MATVIEEEKKLERIVDARMLAVSLEMLDAAVACKEASGKAENLAVQERMLELSKVAAETAALLRNTVQTHNHVSIIAIDAAVRKAGDRLGRLSAGGE